MSDTWDEVRQAWAYNEKVEFFNELSNKWEEWKDSTRIDYNHGLEWRIKPEPLRVRVRSMATGMVVLEKWYPGTSEPSIDGARWLSDWIEVPA